MSKLTGFIPCPLLLYILGAAAEAADPCVQTRASCGPLSTQKQVSLLQLPTQRLTKKLPGAVSLPQPDKAPGEAGGNGRAVSLLDHAAATVLGDGPDADSPFGSAVKQLGFAVLLGLLCVGGIAAHRFFTGKNDVVHAAIAAGVFQTLVIVAAVAIFLLSVAVTIPGYLVVFAVGTAYNVCVHLGEAQK